VAEVGERPRPVEIEPAASPSDLFCSRHSLDRARRHGSEAVVEETAAHTRQVFTINGGKSNYDCVVLWKLQPRSHRQPHVQDRRREIG
jgi:hypothetical protein